MPSENRVNIILLQETHCESEDNLQLEGFDLTCFVPHKKHGIASFVKQGIQVSSILQSSENSSTEWITFEAMGTHFYNIYKPPPAEVDFISLPVIQPRTFVCGDFNCRNTAWGYPNTDNNGKAVLEWIEAENLQLLFDNKDPPTFYSSSHRTWTCPDLSMVSSDIRPRCSRTVLPRFPKSGHCPILVTSDVKVAISSLYKKRWNFRKANLLHNCHLKCQNQLHQQCIF